MKHELHEWSRRLDEVLGLSRMPLRRLAGQVAGLSDILVGKAHRPRYLEDRELLEAYGAFYFPQSFSRTWFVLDEIFRLTDFTVPPGGLRLLDVGAGPGASLLAACEVLQAKAPGFRADALEAVPEASRVLRSILEPSPFRSSVSVHSGDFSRWQAGGYNLVVLSTALSEIAAPGGPDRALAERLWSLTASPGCLVVIEPSWKKGFDLIADLGRALGMRPVLPCRLAESCILDSERDWCHASLEPALPELARRVNQLLGHNLNHIKFTYGVFGRDVRPLARGARIISPPRREKGKVRMRVCSGGRALWLERLNRDRRGPAAGLDECRWGDLVEYEGRELPGGVVRLSAIRKIPGRDSGMPREGD
jgi:ribosomal protein RSM22 (predicted rRNA methylase)